METKNPYNIEGSLQISGEAIEKIARLAALEIEGVAEVRCGASPISNGLKGVLQQPKPILVAINNDVADVDVSLVLAYGVSVPEISEKVQKNVKDTIQNMTTITVGRVNVTVVGVAQAKED